MAIPLTDTDIEQICLGYILSYEATLLTLVPQEFQPLTKKDALRILTQAAMIYERVTTDNAFSATLEAPQP